MRGARGHRRTLRGSTRLLHTSANEDEGAEGKWRPQGPLSGGFERGDRGTREYAGRYSLPVSKWAARPPEPLP